MSTTVARRQHLNALARANEIRLARSVLKRRIARGEVRVVDVLLAVPVGAETWPVLDALMSQRGWGRERAFKLLWRISIPEAKALGALTERQRSRLATALGYRVNGSNEGGVADGS